jgi:hypothetical protein
MEILQLLCSRRCPLADTPQFIAQCQSYVTTDGQSASLPWNKAPICGPKARSFLLSDSSGLLEWGRFSDERTGLPFTVAAGPRQRNHFWVLVLRDS